jgi:hypothetical protein
MKSLLREYLPQSGILLRGIFFMTDELKMPERADDELQNALGIVGDLLESGHLNQLDESGVRFLRDLVQSSPEEGLIAELVGALRKISAQTKIEGGRNAGKFYELAMRQKQIAAEALSKARSSVSAPNEWQPIETAPKDGSLILLTRQGCIYKFTGTYCAYWNNDIDEWMFHQEGIVRNATHWMALPAAPVQGGSHE